jgi:hypothetical protein
MIRQLEVRPEDRRAAARNASAGAALALLGAALLSTPARALTDEEVYRTFRFRPEVPGARATGLGGASIGLADEGTAAYINPAGLGWTDRPEVLADVILHDVDDEIVGTQGAFDLLGTETYASGRVELEEESLAGVGFLSYTHPVLDHLVIGVSRHERMNVERDVLATFTSTAFPTLEGSAPGVPRTAQETKGTLDVLMDTYSVSFASAVIEQLSLGLTVSLARLDIVQTIDNLGYDLEDADGDELPDAFLQTLDYRTVIDDDDTAFTFTAGLLYRPHEKVGLGLVYRDGPEFEVIETIEGSGKLAADVREYFASPAPGRGPVANLNGELLNTWTFPDSYGAGISLGPWFEGRGGGGLIVVADAVRVEYTDILDSFVAGLNAQLLASDSEGVTYAVDDATEYHLGIGYSWTVGYNNAIRVAGGVYSEADRRILSSGRVTTAVNPSTGSVARAGVWPDAEDDEIHFTLGAGFTLKRGFYSFELDGAADVSDIGTTYMGTAAFTF